MWPAVRTPPWRAGAPTRRAARMPRWAAARATRRRAALPVSTWNYQAQGDGVRHMGPTAQDFKAAFGLGEDEQTISVVDEQGVALAAIQGLYAENQALAARVAMLEQQRGQATAAPA